MRALALRRDGGDEVKFALICGQFAGGKGGQKGRGEMRRGRRSTEK